MTDCTAALVMDESYSTNDVVSAYLKMSYLDRDSFETNKATFGINVFDIASLDYESFNQKREKLRQMLLEVGFSSQSQTSMVRTLSPAGAVAFSQCMAQKSKGLINAWVSNCTGTKVVVTVKTGLGGKAKVKFKIAGAETTDKKDVYNLEANGQVDLLFDVAEKKDFILVINAEETTIKIQDSISLTLEALKRIELKSEMITLEGVIRVGAGCHGSTSGCQINDMATIVAPAGFFLLPHTLARKENGRKIVDTKGIGVRDWGINTEVAVYNGEAYKLDIYPHGVDGNNAHGQGEEAVTYICRAQRDYLEVTYV